MNDRNVIQFAPARAVRERVQFPRLAPERVPRPFVVLENRPALVLDRKPAPKAVNENELRAILKRDADDYWLAVYTLGAMTLLLGVVCFFATGGAA